MITDAASACAAAICYLARTTSKHTAVRFEGGRHPRRCQWCDYETDDLLRMVEDFNVADLEGRISAPFRRLNPNAQRSLVDAALYAPVPA